MIDGGPSVLYDAVALLPARTAMADLVQESTVRDFVADAFAHCKFIGYVEAAVPLFDKAGIVEDHQTRALSADVRKGRGDFSENSGNCGFGRGNRTSK